jgi:hypothetical protein
MIGFVGVLRSESAWKILYAAFIAKCKNWES